MTSSVVYDHEIEDEHKSHQQQPPKPQIIQNNENETKERYDTKEDEPQPTTVHESPESPTDIQFIKPSILHSQSFPNNPQKQMHTQSSMKAIHHLQQQQMEQMLRQRQRESAIQQQMIEQQRVLYQKKLYAKRLQQQQQQKQQMQRRQQSILKQQYQQRVQMQRWHQYRIEQQRKEDGIYYYLYIYV